MHCTNDASHNMKQQNKTISDESGFVKKRKLSIVEREREKKKDGKRKKLVEKVHFSLLKTFLYVSHVQGSTENKNDISFPWNSYRHAVEVRLKEADSHANTKHINNNLT